MSKNYWWVNHNKSFEAESSGNFIWSPKTSSDGKRNESYLNLARTRPGDVVFSYARSRVQAVGVVTRACTDRTSPHIDNRGGQNWAAQGFFVEVEWVPLTNPLNQRDHMELLLPLLPVEHSPLQGSGKSNQNSYLAAVSEAFADVLLGLIDHANVGVSEEVADRLDEIDAEEETIDPSIDVDPVGGTMRRQVGLARRGQGLFRARVMAIEKLCRVTGVAGTALVVASHIKPWKLSSDRERLDGYNGLLLAPHVDRLFDRGFITFKDDGQMLTGGEPVVTTMRRWGIDPAQRLAPLHARHAEYMAFHREKVFGRKRLPG